MSESSIKKLVIYGINHQAQQLYSYILQEKGIKAEAFVVDRAYKEKDKLLGLPVYEFEDVVHRFPPSEYQILLSFGYKNMVKNRQEKFELCKKLGYTLYTFISEKAVVYTDNIGEGSIIYPNVFVAPFVKIGKGCFLENSVSVSHHSIIDDFCFLAPKATICGDVQIEANCFLGANSLHLANRTLVSAGAFLNRDTKEGNICFYGSKDIVCDYEPEKFI